MGDRRFDNIVGPQVTSETPRRMHPGENAGMAVVTAGLGALLLALLIERPWPELWRWPVGGMLLVLAVFLVANLAPIVVWALENAVRRDFSGDGVVGKPHPVLVNPRQGQAAARQQTEAEYSAAFEAFIRGCETDTSLRRWEDKGVSRVQYAEWRETLMGAGYAAWKNDADQRQGWRLLLPAEQIIAEVWRE